MAFAGVWMMDDSDNLDEFMTELNIPPVRRQAVLKSKLLTRILISYHFEKYTVKHVDLKPQEYTFTSNDLHTENLYGKTVVFFTTKISDTKYVHTGKSSYGDIRVTRELVDSQMVLTMELIGGRNKATLRFQKCTR